MSAYVLPNIILLIAIVGLIAVVARHLPEAHKQALASNGKKSSNSGKERLWILVQGRLRGAWRFILEAKGLRDPAGSRYRMKQLLAENRRSVKPRGSVPKITTASQAAVVAEEQPETPPVASTPLRTDRVRVEATVQPQAPVVRSTPMTVSRGPTLQLEEAMVLAKQYLDNKQYFEARKLLDSMGQEPHDSPVFWARLGYAQYHLGSYGEAIRCYEKSLSLDSNQPNRYYNLALAYEAAGNRIKSLSNLDKALKLDSGNLKYLQTQQALTS